MLIGGETFKMLVNKEELIKTRMLLDDEHKPGQRDGEK